MTRTLPMLLAPGCFAWMPVVKENQAPVIDTDASTREGTVYIDPQADTGQAAETINVVVTDPDGDALDATWTVDNQDEVSLTLEGDGLLRYELFNEPDALYPYQVTLTVRDPYNPALFLQWTVFLDEGL